MAESNSNNTNGKPSDFDEELDETLQDASGGINKHEDDVLNDEDAIDRLLMNDDESFDDPEQQTTEQVNHEASDVEAIDEFSDIDDLIDSVIVDKDKSNSLAESLDKGKDRMNITDSEESEQDIFDEIDEFTDEGDSQETGSELQQERADSQLSAADADQNDFFTEAFDISSDDDDEITVTADPVVQETVADNELTSDSDLSADELSGEQANDVIGVDELHTNIDETLSAQVVKLIAELDGVKLDVAATSDSIENTAKVARITGQAQEKVNKSNQILSYAALVVAAIAFIVAAFISYVNTGLQSEIDELTGLVTDLEVLTVNANKQINPEIIAVKKSVAETEKEMLLVKGQLDDLMDQSKAVALQVPEANEAIKQKVSVFENQLVDVNQKINTLQRQVAKLKKPKPAAAQKSKKIPTATEWTVNLVSFKQEWYAKKKAAEFKKQGIPVEVVNATIKGEQWYRIRVSGFKSKYEAGSYAARVKKALNLSSVWVTRK